MTYPHQEPSKKKLFESFPKDRTIPGNWEFDGLKPSPLVESKSKRNEKALESNPIIKLDTFPKPRTIPGQWDM